MFEEVPRGRRGLAAYLGVGQLTARRIVLGPFVIGGGVCWPRSAARSRSRPPSSPPPPSAPATCRRTRTQSGGHRGGVHGQPAAGSSRTGRTARPAPVASGHRRPRSRRSAPALAPAMPTVHRCRWLRSRRAQRPRRHRLHCGRTVAEPGRLDQHRFGRRQHQRTPEPGRQRHRLRQRLGRRQQAAGASSSPRSARAPGRSTATSIRSPRPNSTPPRLAADLHVISGGQLCPPAGSSCTVDQLIAGTGRVSSPMLAIDPAAAVHRCPSWTTTTQYSPPDRRPRADLAPTSHRPPPGTRRPVSRPATADPARTSQPTAVAADDEAVRAAWSRAAVACCPAGAGCAAAGKQSARLQPAPAAARPATRTAGSRARASDCTPGATLAADRRLLRPGCGVQPPPAAGDRSMPVVELLRDGVHSRWWIGRLGSGWSAQLHLPGRATLRGAPPAGRARRRAEMLLLRRRDAHRPGHRQRRVRLRERRSSRTWTATVRSTSSASRTTTSPTSPRATTTGPPTG